ncbi:DUF2920 domain-containing protein [Campylobacter novaezeelandiae]|uniref:DUF2920 family protein n=1 Tax=Campylobacter novaezeelandiae TaxID=2267891 RepID=UPI001C1E045E|nr:DUF2920 family protein [Campylobacter novaezeelandiae]QWU80606.1 DUF2920 domain-containing protein [Campylobacter novaezeelandiae]
MLINKFYEINSCDDVELNIKRESKLEYRITFDDSKDLKAIVFIIGGFGANANISFLDFDREYLAKNFDVVVVNVFYHCFCMRKSLDEKYSAITSFTNLDLPNLKSCLETFNLNTHNLTTDNAQVYYEILNQTLYELKSQNKLDKNYKAIFTSTFIPPNNEYQNYGIMAAIDHINALKDIVKNYPEFKNLPKIYGGGSYGGYLSLLIAKIAPWYVDGVIDNSGGAFPNLASILGREFGVSDYTFNDPNTFIQTYVKTFWTRDINSNFYFSDENYMIRALLNKDHILLQNEKNKNIIYISYHSLKDEFKTADSKKCLYDFYKNLGFDSTLHLIESEDQIDGKLVKSLEHSLRMTDKALFRQELPIVLEKLKNRNSFMKENSISYPCKNKVFTFKDKEDKFVLEIK